MKIFEDIYHKMIDCPSVPPECGGILGADRENTINHIRFDKGIRTGNGGVYIPNIPFLNRLIEEWAEDGIEFQGIFHTHAPHWPELSHDDRVYIIDILNVMPRNIMQLYFPLVFPGRNIKGYCVNRRNGITDIVDDDIEIINRGGNIK